MRKLWAILSKHIQLDFNPLLYLSVGLFLAISIFVNYSLDLEDSVIDKDAGKPIRILWYLLLYGYAYYGATLITLHFTGKLSLLKTKRFWLLTLVGLIILSWNVGFPYLTPITQAVIPNGRIFSWAYSSGSNVINFFTTALPLLLVSLILKDKERFGANQHQVDLSPYYWLLLVIVPMITIASFEPGFKNYYPTYKANTVAEILQWPSFLPVVIYEIVYGLDFFNVEFMFRGFLVIGLSHLLGKEAILPMVCTYCFLHFGKPIGESISSIFGGYILGVVAFYTRNIWGGVIVHMGLAWMMELAAFVQKNT
jgi:hypothetical protein